VANDERGATRWTLTGVHSADAAGIPAAHVSVTISGQDLFRLQNGRIVELWQAFDWKAIAQQVSEGAGQAA